jgi:hypothetical protein
MKSLLQTHLYRGFYIFHQRAVVEPCDARRWDEKEAGQDHTDPVISSALHSPSLTLHVPCLAVPCVPLTFVVFPPKHTYIIDFIDFIDLEALQVIH